MRKSLLIVLALALVIGMASGVAQAQREEQTRGAIQGMVYEDVDGDGRCVNTGVAGEGPVGGVDVEFVSSDEETVLTMYSSPDGAFGLFAAGFSYWRLTAKPGPEWVVTSENPIYAPIDKDDPAINGLFFCVQDADAAPVYLPQSGGGLSALGMAGTAVFGLGLLLAGAGLEWRRRR